MEDFYLTLFTNIIISDVNIIKINVTLKGISAHWVFLHYPSKSYNKK